MTRQTLIEVGEFASLKPALPHSSFTIYEKGLNNNKVIYSSNKESKQNLSLYAIQRKSGIASEQKKRGGGGGVGKS